MKKLNAILGIGILIIASSAMATDYVCQSDELTPAEHAGASVEFSDTTTDPLNPVVFKYAGKRYELEIPVKRHLTCLYSEEEAGPCDGTQQAAIKSIYYSAESWSDLNKFRFQLLWEISPINPSHVRYASVAPLFLGIRGNISLACIDKSVSGADQ